MRLRTAAIEESSVSCVGGRAGMALRHGAPAGLGVVWQTTGRLRALVGVPRHARTAREAWGSGLV
eukprot:COSAG02_NODE_508_length_20916_cov_162.483691_2_plen_65_part_00